MAITDGSKSTQRQRTRDRESAARGVGCVRSTSPAVGQTTPHTLARPRSASQNPIRVCSTRTASQCEISRLQARDAAGSPRCELVVLAAQHPVQAAFKRVPLSVSFCSCHRSLTPCCFKPRRSLLSRASLRGPDDRTTPAGVSGDGPRHASRRTQAGVC